MKKIKPQTHPSPLPSKGRGTKTQKKNVLNIPLFKGEWPQAKGVLISGILLLFLILFISLFTNKNQTPQFRKASLLSSWDYQSIQPNSEIIISTKSDRQTGTVNLQYHQSHVEFELPLANSQIKQIAPDKISFVTDKKTIEPQYQVLSNGIKENLILHQIPNTNEFASTIKTSNADLYFNAENLPVFLDSKTKEYLFHIQKPYAFDANGNRTYAVTYQIQSKGGFPYPPPSKSSLPLLGALFPAQSSVETKDSYTLVLKIDSQWLFDKSRAYPITIDPTIVHDTQSEFASGSYNRIQDTGLGDTAPNLETYYQELSADINTVGLWHMNEASGTTIADSSGNNWIGTLGTGGSAPGLGKSSILGVGASFDETDYIDLSLGSTLSSNTSFTFEAWVYPISIGTTRVRTILGNLVNGGPQFRLGSTNKLSLLKQNIINMGSSVETVANDIWSHVAVTYNPSGNFTFYINGINVGSGTSPQTFVFGKQAIGIGAGGNEKFNGLIDEVRISNIARTPEQIKADAQRRPYSVYTSPVIDLGATGIYRHDWNSISWTESGVSTGDGETPYSTDGLVAQWNFNETSGITAVSGGSCGTSCNGTLTNFANTSGQDVGGTNDGWTSNNRRWGSGALMFDGVDDYVNAGNNSLLNPTSAISIETWVKPTKLPNSYGGCSYAIIVGKENDGTNGYYSIHFSNDDLACTGTTTPFLRTSYKFSDGSYTNIKGNEIINLGDWYHAVSTYDGSTARFYINGKLQGSSTVNKTLGTNTGNLYFGRMNNASFLYQFSGIIDATRIYSRALTASEILSNYNAANVEVQTRVGNSSDPNDGTWEEWKPETSETTIDSMDTATIEPSDISGLQVWLKADAITGISNGTQFGTWTDSSGAGNNFTQATSTRQPTYSTNVLNGKPVVTFSAGSSQTMTNPINLSSGSNTIIYVVRQTGGANARMLSGLSNNWLLGYWNGAKRQAYFSGWTTPSGSPTTDTSWHIYSTVQTGSNSSVWEDGNNFVSSSTAGIAGPNGLSLSGHYATSEFSNGQIAELIVYNKALNDSERIEIENYLANKYQLGLNNGVRYNNDTNIKIEGTGSKKITSGTLEPDGSTVALWHLDETSGSGAYLKDSTTNANHGTPSGTTVVEGFSDKARSFNGSSNFIQIPASSAFDLQRFTIEAWVNPTTISQNGFIFEKTTNGSVNTQYSCFFEGSSFVFRTYNSSGTIDNLTFTSSSYFLSNQWNHIACIYDGSTKAVYVNGALAASKVYSQTMQTNPSGTSIIGAYGSGTDYFFDGKIDEVRISNVARSAEEIAETYRAGRDHYINKTISSADLSAKTSIPFYVASDRQGSFLNATIGESPFANYQPDANTVGLWHLDESDGPYLNDSYPNFSGWTVGTGSTCGTYNMLGGYGVGGSGFTTSKTISNLPAGTYNVSFNYYHVDSWDGESGRAFWNGSQIWSRPIVYSEQTTTQVCGGTWGDSYGLGLSATVVTVNHPGGNAILTFDSTLDQGPTDESWGINNIKIVGPIIKDSSVNSNNGTPAGTTSTQGKLGQARSFNGSSYVSISDSNSLDLTGNFTISAWVKQEGGGGATIVSKTGASTTGGYAVLWGNSGEVYCRTDNGTTYVDSFTGYGYIVASMNWTHVAAVKTGTSCRIYINGVDSTRYARTHSSQAVNSLPLVIGARADLGGEFTIGKIDEVRISNIARTPDEIRQAYEYGARTHNITIDFKAKLGSGNLITNSSDYSFTIDETAYGSSTKANHLFSGEKIIVKENINGTEYIAQGLVNSVNSSSGAISVSSWDSGSTFPSGGFTVNATVFKWQREYFDITGSLSSHRDSITNLTLRLNDGSKGANIWLDDLRSSGGYLTNFLGSTIPSTLGSRYFQYQIVETSNDTNVSPSVSQVTLDYLTNYSPQTPTLISPSDKVNNQSSNVSLKVTTTDIESNSLQYKITLCTDSAMTANCQVFDQTASQVGWSGQDIGTSAYGSGSTAVFTTPNLSLNTTYYWKSMAIDPNGSNLWGSTQTTPYSFTTSFPISPGNCLIEESMDNSFLKVKWINRTSYLDKFFIEKSIDGSSYSPLITINDIGTTDYTDMNVSKNHTYRYRIAASFLGTNSYWCETPLLNLNSIPVPTTLPENGILIF